MREELLGPYSSLPTHGLLKDYGIGGVSPCLQLCIHLRMPNHLWLLLLSFVPNFYCTFVFISVCFFCKLKMLSELCICFSLVSPDGQIDGWLISIVCQVQSPLRLTSGLILGPFLATESPQIQLCGTR